MLSQTELRSNLPHFIGGKITIHLGADVVDLLFRLLHIGPGDDSPRHRENNTRPVARL